MVSTFGGTGAAKIVKNFRFLRLSGTLQTKVVVVFRAGRLGKSVASPWRDPLQVGRNIRVLEVE
jgi:hypothetical protein